MKPVILSILVTITFLSFTTPAQAKGKALFSLAQPNQYLAIGPASRVERRHERRFHRRGTIINSIPAGSVTISYHGTPYYYANGEYFLIVNNGYRVVAPPAGIRLRNLPTGYSVVLRNGKSYYTVNDVYYQSVNDGGVTVYVTVNI